VGVSTALPPVPFFRALTAGALIAPNQLKLMLQHSIALIAFHLQLLE